MSVHHLQLHFLRQQHALPVPGLVDASGSTFSRRFASAASAFAAWFRQFLAHLESERTLRREADDRREVLALARSYASTQPELAKELYALVGRDRHS